MNISDINRLNQIEADEAMAEEILARADRIIETCHIEELLGEATHKEWLVIKEIARRMVAAEIQEEMEYEKAEQEYRRRENREDWR